MMYNASQLQTKINEYIATLDYKRPPVGLYEPVEYTLALGGKRIRPVLMLMAYNMYKEEVEAILPSAVAIETYHNYTLLHDDLMDKADLRRGNPTVHKKWDENTAILSGDTMLVLAYKMMCQCDGKYLKAVMDIFNETALEIGEGQQFDMEFETRNNVTEKEYLEMIRLKTSVLLAASLQIGAVQAGASDEDARNLYDFGLQLGLAFQLQDDYLDVYGDPVVFGKRVGGDILCNKKTYMLINAFQLADEAQRAELERWIAAEDYNPEEKVSAVTALYDAIGIKELCHRKIESYFHAAEACLDKVTVDNGRKQVLRNFALSLMGRKV
ncbi:MAG: polyprenyl synthetase family protein [Bacteroidaceae bacterium]|nr:polyprenyl synthetase family protein [Bacteroidaceae bacterium]